MELVFWGSQGQYNHNFWMHLENFNFGDSAPLVSVCLSVCQCMCAYVCVCMCVCVCVLCVCLYVCVKADCSPVVGCGQSPELVAEGTNGSGSQFKEVAAATKEGRGNLRGLRWRRMKLKSTQTKEGQGGG